MRRFRARKLDLKAEIDGPRALPSLVEGEFWGLIKSREVLPDPSAEHLKVSRQA